MGAQLPELLIELVERADAGDHVQFELIQSWEEYILTYRKLRALQTVIKVLKTGSEKLLKLYCKDVKAGQADLNALLISQALADTINFYKEEFKIVHDMLDEYELYLLSGNLLNFGSRKEDTLWDHREASLWTNH